MVKAVSEEIDRDKFSKIIRELRSDRNVRDFGEIIGVSHATVVSWEKGETLPKRKNLEKIAALRGEDPEELLAYLENRQQLPEKNVPTIDRALLTIKYADKKDLVRLLKEIVQRLDEM